MSNLEHLADNVKAARAEYEAAITQREAMRAGLESADSAEDAARAAYRDAKVALLLAAGAAEGIGL